MALADALAAVIRDWAAVSARLGPEERDTARRLLAAFAHGGRREPRHLLEVLLAPQPADHPAWQALQSRPRRGPTAAEPTGVVAMRLRQLIELSGPADLGDDPEDIDADAEHRIWLVPMEQLEQLPPHERPLVLEHAGSVYAPLFQFDPDGHLRPAAARVNALLDAEEDPWGAASWWLAPHAALHAIPADALLAGRAEDVLAAAAAAKR